MSPAVRLLALSALAPALTAGLAPLPATACNDSRYVPRGSRVRVYACTTAEEAEAALLSDEVVSGDGMPGYAPSPDGRGLALVRRDAIEVLVADRRHLVAVPGAHQARSPVTWSPDGRWIAAFGRPTALGSHLIDLSPRTLLFLELPADAATAPVVHVAPLLEGPRSVPYGHTWTAGDRPALLVLASERGPPPTSSVQRFVPGAERRTTLFRRAGMIDFVLTRTGCSDFPRSPGSGLEGALVGSPACQLELWRDGQPRRVGRLPSLGITNCDWHPTEPRLLLYYRRPVVNEVGEVVAGLVEVDADSGEHVLLRPQRDVHSLWYSPRGAYASWATEQAVYVAERQTGDELGVALQGLEAKAVEVPAPIVAGAPLPITGFAWDSTETRLAITAGDRLLLHDLTTGTTRTLAALGATEAGRYAAKPWFVGDDRVLLTVIDPAPRQR